MEKQDVVIYGHLTHDIIFDGLDKKETLGAIANVWSDLLYFNPDLQISLVPISIGKAIILIDKEAGTRISRPMMNLKVNKSFEFIKSRISHVIYINKLKDLSFLKDLSNYSEIVTADISVGGKIPYKYLKYIDYLFIADEDIEGTVDNLVNYTKGNLIQHHSGGSVSIFKGEKIIHNVETIENLNVLGAGDTFASAFISLLLKKNKINYKELIRKTHQLTGDLLVKKNI